MTGIFDVGVVGSGPSGALAAWKLVEAGLEVLMLDVGHDDDHYRQMIPDLPFERIRGEDPDQRRYLLGDALEGVPRGGVRVGAQLTPPRQFVTRDTEELLPYSGDGFEPMQSLALGGLGATWGAASFTYSPSELRGAGIHEDGFERFYEEVSRQVGISADARDDAAPDCFAGVTDHLPPLEIDSVSKCLLESYRAKRDSCMRGGLSMGRTPLAILSRDFGNRSANPYFDMDFWSESRRSVFRPRYLIEELRRRRNFHIAPGNLVVGFESEGGDGVSIRCRDLEQNTPSCFRVRRLVLCAGAINSGRIALNSLGRVREKVPILCNPYVYIPCINLRMLGRPAADPRHSLSQLIAIYKPRDAPDDLVSVQFYGYRSLLMFKLVKEIPLPPWAGLQVARLVASGLMIAGLHHSDSPRAEKSMQILSREGAALPEVRFEYAASADEERRRTQREKALSRLLRSLGLLPYARISPGNASSIHYAGTIPIDPAPGSDWGCRSDGRLLGAPNVYVGDSSGWRFLPAKGLTFTLMANAVRVAEHVVRDLRSSS